MACPLVAWVSKHYVIRMAPMLTTHLDFMNQMFADPEMQEILADPTVMQKLQSIMQNPANIGMYQDDPKIQKIMNKIMGQFGGK